jgi:hypothetical protein
LGVCSTVPVVALFLVTAEGMPAIIALTASLLGLPLPVCAAIALLSPDSRHVREVISPHGADRGHADPARGGVRDLRCGA